MLSVGRASHLLRSIFLNLFLGHRISLRNTSVPPKSLQLLHGKCDIGSFHAIEIQTNDHPFLS